MPIDSSKTAAAVAVRPAVGWHRLWRRALFLLFAAACTLPALADPPERAGRLAGTIGGVWVYSPGTGEWLGGSRNLPLTGGDRIATDADGRADIRIGSTALHLDAGSDLELLRLDDDALAVRLHRGSVALALRSGEAARGFELYAGDGRFTAAQPGRFRIDHDAVAGVDRITAWRGEALFQAPGVAVPVLAGERADLWRDRTGRVAPPVRAQPAEDDFAGWAAALDRADDRATVGAARYLPPEMTGAEDLFVDDYGRWQIDAEYGALWLPAGVAADWAPYRDGRWAWVEPWGWSWVDAAPWGFAPFHYGRWVTVGGRWAWSPGQRTARPVYAPALVAWAGGSGGLAATLAGGGRGPAVGWFPLGPREVFVPGYRASPRYLREVNRAQVPDLGDANRYLADPEQALRQGRYMHRDRPSAWTVVPAAVVAGRQPVAPALLPFGDGPPRRDWRRGDAADRPRDGVRGVLPGLAGLAIAATAPVAGPQPRPGRVADPRAAVAAPGQPPSPPVGAIRGPLPGGRGDRSLGGPDMGPTTAQPQPQLQLQPQVQLPFPPRPPVQLLPPGMPSMPASVSTPRRPGDGGPTGLPRLQPGASAGAAASPADAVPVGVPSAGTPGLPSPRSAVAPFAGRSALPQPPVDGGAMSAPLPGSSPAAEARRSPPGYRSDAERGPDARQPDDPRRREPPMADRRLQEAQHAAEQQRALQPGVPSQRDQLQQQLQMQMQLQERQRQQEQRLQQQQQQQQQQLQLQQQRMQDQQRVQEQQQRALQLRSQEQQQIQLHQLQQLQERQRQQEQQRRMQDQAQRPPGAGPDIHMRREPREGRDR